MKSFDIYIFNRYAQLVFLKQYYFIIKTNKQQQMQRRVSDYRPSSPIRSPIRSPVRVRVQTRQVSPIRVSPFSRNVPMSPIRNRIATKPSTTPTKTRIHLQQHFLRSPRNYNQHIQPNDTHTMQKTFKSGIGLFQKLAQEHKIGSERKQNRYASHTGNHAAYYEIKAVNIKISQFQLQQNKLVKEKEKPKDNTRKFQQSLLLKNARQVQSIQTIKQEHSPNLLYPHHQNSNISSHLQNTIRIQNKLHPNESFGKNPISYAPSSLSNYKNNDASRQSSQLGVDGQKKKAEIKEQSHANLPNLDKTTNPNTHLKANFSLNKKQNIGLEKALSPPPKQQVIAKQMQKQYDEKQQHQQLQLITTSITKQKQKKQVSQSFQFINFLLNKARSKVPQSQSIDEQNVKKSTKQCTISFNMNPFL